MIDIAKIAYEKYKIDWMMSHGYTLNAIYDLAEAWLEDSKFDDNHNSLGEYIEDIGFNGILWACFDEFLDYEFTDKEYIQKLLTKDEFVYWLAVQPHMFYTVSFWRGVGPYISRVIVDMEDVTNNAQEIIDAAIKRLVDKNDSAVRPWWSRKLEDEFNGDEYVTDSDGNYMLIHHGHFKINPTTVFEIEDEIKDKKVVSDPFLFFPAGTPTATIKEWAKKCLNEE